MDQTFSKKSTPKHLAWHETLEIHELVAFQAIGLMKLKKAYPEVKCQTLKALYTEAITGLSTNIRELLKFYDLAPSQQRANEYRDDELPFYAGDLLALFKTGVRNYSIAITETATPELRRVLKQQLNRAIDTHAKVFEYMHNRGYYPAYNLNELLQNDVDIANKALTKSI
ncbi:spore coat protein [Anaerobacillus isosaccharinicus]|uniref:Spore coat protein n=1 Tax=Anaerobacillus isosaccharinicus TaxID=1532552 RepID=A0A1S2MDT2_9BACI|nr:spore coat protein [Anaerobacillus isosaccharinicus]MBA5588787.1 spore coat protein [Anaerobacillus isosaccharinicus]QOY37818.1 spore coat protein [Anaerobacillus isosaccharinicus]